MNAVEIEEAISKLAEQAFDPAAFPYAFLEAFGNKATTIKRLKSGDSNQSDIEDGVLQRNHIHIATCPAGEVHQTLEKLRASPATTKQKAKFILATDGITLEAEELTADEPPIACDYADFPNHFGFFLPLAGITTVKQIRESSFDIKATGRLNRLYVELLKDNPEWGKAERRHDMNHFMARLIFCFFAEDTDIFNGTGLFTATVEQMSARDSSNTHEVISEIFRAMDTKIADRANAKIKSWANVFPYVNGNLFSGSTETPCFSKIARSYLLNVGKLEWQKINPDIFGSMIQAVTEDEERGALGMHYTSVPNILKVLNPLFLDDLRAQLEAAENSPQKLLNLRKRIARIRVFDPACGSGNFLVIAYKQMREIEAEINKRRGEKGRKSDIPLTNFRGIELRDFPAEVARLALIIAEYQCDVLYCGQKEALEAFLPLDKENWITCGNALELDWLDICPPTGRGVKIHANDLFKTPLDQAQIDFENEGGETYICGNPPYLGSTGQSDEQKEDLKAIFGHRIKSWKTLDYVAGWFMKAADYTAITPATTAFVTTNSICQGEMVPILWPQIFAKNMEIVFAHTSFKWANLASHNAGVTVAIVGVSRKGNTPKILYSEDTEGMQARAVDKIGAYLIGGSDAIVEKRTVALGELAEMIRGNTPWDGGNLLLSSAELSGLGLTPSQQEKFVRRMYGSEEFIQGKLRYCLWINDADLNEARNIPSICRRIDAVKQLRGSSKTASTAAKAAIAHRFGQIQEIAKTAQIIVPRHSSESRPYLPVGFSDSHAIIADSAFSLYDAPLWNLAIIASKLHLIWIATVCGKLETRYRYSNTLGWNTFPIPQLTEKQKADLTHCAENILLAQEHHFPATIAELYGTDKEGNSKMPDNLST